MVISARDLISAVRCVSGLASSTLDWLSTIQRLPAGGLNGSRAAAAGVQTACSASAANAATSVLARRKVFAFGCIMRLSRPLVAAWRERVQDAAGQQRDFHHLRCGGHRAGFAFRLDCARAQATDDA